MGPKPKPAAPVAPPVAQGEYLKKDLDILYVKESTMKESMQEAAVNALREGLDKYNLERDIAGHVKQVFEKTYGKYWQCFVGKNYGSFISYEDYYIFFYLGRVAVVLYKIGSEDDENEYILNEVENDEYDVQKDEKNKNKERSKDNINNKNNNKDNIRDNNTRTMRTTRPR